MKLPPLFAAHRVRHFATTGLIVLELLFFLAGPNQLVNADASIGISPAGGPPLSTVQVSGQGFCPTCGMITISMNSQTIGHADADTNGQFSTSVQVPGTVSPGQNTVTASQNGQGGNTITARDSYYVVISSQPTKQPTASPTVNQTPSQSPRSSSSATTPAPGVVAAAVPNKADASKRSWLLFALLVLLMTSTIYLLVRRQRAARLRRVKARRR